MKTFLEYMKQLESKDRPSEISRGLKKKIKIADDISSEAVTAEEHRIAALRCRIAAEALSRADHHDLANKYFKLHADHLRARINAPTSFWGHMSPEQQADELIKLGDI